MSGIWRELIIAFLGASGVFSFIMFMITRHDKKKDAEKENEKDQAFKEEEIRDELKSIMDLLQELKDQAFKNEKDNVRTQLLVLMADYPDNTAELLECAKHYFVDMDGDWYLTPIFAKFIEARDVAKPEWLLGNKYMNREQ